MAPPSPVTPPAVFTSSLASAPSEALEAAGGIAFEVDGWAEGPDFFFLGAMVDGIVEDEDGDEDDALRMLSGSHKRAPYVARQRCRGISAATYGTGWPLTGSTGDVATKSRPVCSSTAERTQAIYPGSGHREA